MTKEYLGEAALTDLFDIMLENFVTNEVMENRDKELTSSISAGAAMIAAALLKVAESISATGGVGGVISEDLVATDEEVDEILNRYFGKEEN